MLFVPVFAFVFAFTALFFFGSVFALEDGLFGFVPVFCLVFGCVDAVFDDPLVLLAEVVFAAVLLDAVLVFLELEADLVPVLCDDVPLLFVTDFLPLLRTSLLLFLSLGTSHALLLYSLYICAQGRKPFIKSLVPSVKMS